MQEALPFVTLAVGLLVGVAAAWFVCRSRMAAGKATLVERLQGREQAILELNGRLNQAATDLQAAHGQVTTLNAKAAHLEATLDQERRQAQEKLAIVNDAQQKLSDAFKALAAEALSSNNQSFLELAKTALEKSHEVVRGDLEKRQTAIAELVTPVKASLDKVDEKIRGLEAVREGAYQGLLKQVDGLLETQRQLRQETGNLVKALRSPVVRGRWGEIQLRKVVELAGMVNHCDFCEQQSVEGENGRLRPDLIVKLPAQKQVVVDSKCPLSAYLEALDCTDDEARKEKLQAHAKAVRTHITALSRKSYFEQFDQTPEFVVLFMPGEVFFSAALEHDPELIEAGVEQNVIIATPTTLIALLRAVAYGWRQERLAENAKAISDLGAELYKRLVTVGDYLSTLGKKLKGAVEAYNDTVASLETRVLTTARTFDDLHVSTAGTEIGQIIRDAPSASLRPSHLIQDCISYGYLESGDEWRASVPAGEESAVDQELDHHVMHRGVNVRILDASISQTTSQIGDEIEIVQLHELLLRLLSPDLRRSTSKLLAEKCVELASWKLARHFEQVEEVENVAGVRVIDQPFSETLETHACM